MPIPQRVMTTRKKIILAVVNGCRNTREVAEYIGISYGAVNNYFYESGSTLKRFVNGELLQWQPHKAMTLQTGPRTAIIRGPDSVIKDVGMVADMNDLEASFNEN